MHIVVKRLHDEDAIESRMSILASRNCRELEGAIGIACMQFSNFKTSLTFHNLLPCIAHAQARRSIMLCSGMLH